MINALWFFFVAFGLLFSFWFLHYLNYRRKFRKKYGSIYTIAKLRIKRKDRYL